MLRAAVDVERSTTVRAAGPFKLPLELVIIIVVVLVFVNHNINVIAVLIEAGTFLFFLVHIFEFYL